MWDPVDLLQPYLFLFYVSQYEPSQYLSFIWQRINF